MLSVLHVNCSILFTFADAQPPPAMEVVKKANIPHNNETMFKFNNSAVYASRDDESTGFFWNFGYKSLEKYFDNLGKITPVSLDTTKNVLAYRDWLQYYLERLRLEIDNGMEKLQNIESVNFEIMRLQECMQFLIS